MNIIRTITMVFAITSAFSSCGIFNKDSNQDSDGKSDEERNRSSYRFVSEIDWSRLPSASDLPSIVTGKASGLNLTETANCRTNDEAKKFRELFENALTNEVRTPDTKLCTGQDIEIGKTYRNVTPGLVQADGYREQVFSFIANSNNEISQVICDAETLIPTRASNFVLEDSEGTSKIEYISQSPHSSYRLLERKSNGYLSIRDRYQIEASETPESSSGDDTGSASAGQTRTADEPEVNQTEPDSDNIQQATNLNLVDSYVRKYSFSANYDSNGQGVSVEMSYRPDRSFTRQSFFITDYGMTEFLIGESKNKIFFDTNLYEISVTALTKEFYDNYGNIGDIRLPEETHSDFEIPQIALSQCSPNIIEYDCSGVVDNENEIDNIQGANEINQCQQEIVDDEGNNGTGPDLGWSVAQQKHNGYTEKYVTIELSPNSSSGVPQGSYIGLRATVLNPDESVTDVSSQFVITDDTDIMIHNVSTLCGSINRASDYLQTQPSVRVASNNDDICEIYKNYPVILLVRGQGSPSAPFSMRDGRGTISVQLQ